MPPCTQSQQVAIGYSAPVFKRMTGRRCQFNPDCLSDCCVRKVGERTFTCQPLSALEELCSTGQIKGGRYAYGCPCESDQDLECVYTGNGTNSCAVRSLIQGFDDH
ncbi:PREDICTED: uncharacterized protein LOC106811137 [Priapulus caudatus]|uniref:Uncharacterized protein LOC106811137 n=1 Tax=Priapulus caudatus TaxID=37621 RepID=A0ABM1ED94_PRICU|nr:PREDICTED: uncharacterized protein LOC106811137 [Priapulus caudatus]